MNPSEKVHFEQPRRKDRAVEDEAWIRDMLTRSPLGVLATIGEDGPSLNPNLFVFDPEADVLYLHTAKKGSTRTHIESHERVAFSVSEMGRILPADAAIHFSVEYASVVLQGTASVVEDATEAAKAMDLLMRKYAPHLEPGHHYRGVDAKDLAKTSVYRVDIESWTGKGKYSEAADAYSYPTCQAALENLKTLSQDAAERRSTRGKPSREPVKESLRR